MHLIPWDLVLLTTQVVPARLQPQVAQAVAYAAGRYLHVMFPENAHEVGAWKAGRVE